MTMTKGTKIFRIILCVLLGITVLWTAFVSYAFFSFVNEDVDRRYTERYGLYVGGVDVTYGNAHDILGDGTASYDVKTNKLTLNNATIEYNYNPIQADHDLRIELVGENKLICKDKENINAIYASNGILRKDISIDGDGTLEISFVNVTGSGTGIVAEDLWIGADVTITTPDGVDIANGIVCTSNLTLRNEATVTVRNGSARSSTAVSVRNNAIIEAGSTLDISAAPGSTGACNGLGVGGNLNLAKNSSLTVSVDDETAETSACVSVSSNVSVGRGASVTLSSKKAYGIDCSGSVELREGATVTANTAAEGADVYCNGALVNDGGTVQGEVNALGGIHNKDGN